MLSKNFSELSLLLRIPYNCTRDNCCLVDVGAHVGGVSLEFARRGWRVVAFEPEPKNYRHLSETLSDFADTIIVNKAVSDVAGQQVPFYISTEHHGIHSLQPFHESHQAKLTVETVRLDETLVQLAIKHITVLKIDIEGADYLAIKSFDFNRYRPDVILCEFMDERSRTNYDYTHHDVVTYMKQWGYACYVSEWAPIVEYARHGQETNAHRFIQCVPYPLDHEPAWGNLFFVPEDKIALFQQTLHQYQRFASFAAVIKAIPGATILYRKYRQWRSR